MIVLLALLFNGLRRLLAPFAALTWPQSRLSTAREAAVIVACQRIILLAPVHEPPPRPLNLH